MDDGSTDGTEQIVKEWISENKFPIAYMFQKNSGKHVAVNRGVEKAKGDFFLIADSDDSFFPNTLEILWHHWSQIKEDDKQHFTGVSGLCVDDSEKIVGTKYPADIFDSNNLDIFYKFAVSGEKWGFNRTEILKQYPFPEIEGFHFYGEGLIWNRIARKYKTRYINQFLRKYHSDSGNQITKTTPQNTSKNNIFYVKTVNDDHDYILTAPRVFFRICMYGSRLSFHQNIPLRSQIALLSDWKGKLFWGIASPFGFLLFLTDKLRFK